MPQSAGEYSLEYTQSAVEHVKAIGDRRVREKLRKRIQELKIDPEKQAKPLRGNLQGLLSVRAVGQRYRIIFEVLQNDRKVRIWFVGIRKEGHKTDIYELAARLLAKMRFRR